MPKSGNMANAIQNAEHIGPLDTGDNIEAKRVANYTWNSRTSQWERATVDTQIMGVASIAHAQVALSTSSAQVAAARATRRSITIVNLSAIDVYIGNTGVTTSTGQLLLGTRGASITIETVTAVFAVAASGTPSVSYLEEYA